MLPLSLLKTAQGHPMLVELKNGETYNGHLVNCDTWMNIHLREVICTSKDGDRFWRMPECYIRGNTIKYLRVPDEVIDKVQEEAKNRTDRKPPGVVGRGRGRGRDDGGGRPVKGIGRGLDDGGSKGIGGGRVVVAEVDLAVEVVLVEVEVVAVANSDGSERDENAKFIKSLPSLCVFVHEYVLTGLNVKNMMLVFFVI
ncbi:uncharacterized protein A4U43_C05F9380 [Asparagus officinalis]|uniref:U6 snRNA-associated Sm-like protein LSm4 n=1 Tax=Asparagus officinalis TaxID=4686 RepID=A0A5P1EU61_ASPOF|nr:uncharacterized protein A4U43_C05F9380 [Asparagus officinalis]